MDKEKGMRCTVLVEMGERDCVSLRAENLNGPGDIGFVKA